MAQASASLVGAKMIRVLEPWLPRGFEDGRNNRGAFPDLVQRADDLPGEGYAWCASTMAWALEKVLGRDVPISGEAAVASWLAWGRRMNWIVKRPFRGDLVCFRFRSQDKVDHIGVIFRVLKLGAMLRIVTIEGNTGPAGAVSDPGTGRDGLYKKVRWVRARDVEFIRLPNSLLPTKPKPTPLPKQVRIAGRVFKLTRVNGAPTYTIKGSQ